MKANDAKNIALVNWEGVDRILFGKKDVKKYLGPKYESYLGTKHAFLYTVFELHKLWKTDSPAHALTENTMKSILKNVNEITCFYLKENANVKNDIVKKVKAAIMEGTESKVAVLGASIEKHMSMNLDNLTIALPMMESKTKKNKKADKIEESVLRETYNLLKEELITYAIG